ncbi:MAG: hypothetical protein KIT33_11600 [Candidatus Kapabacteria bacterium]|nr:hypothetical protein [Ignavibacteriota bacterium]MCW5885604.1 hypothetical protein [Candidatus Kapabacteria bacterium]
MKIKLFYIIVFITAYFLNSCCDCGVEPVNNPQFDCLVREATITEFNAELIRIDDEFKPGPSYSVHNFVFPAGNNLTGTFVNDERFALTGEIVVSSLNYSNNQAFKIAIFDNSPINSAMMGDILIMDVNMIDTTADLKFKGNLARITDDFLTDNANLFCDYIDFNRDLIISSIDNLSQYGRGIQGSFVPRNYTQNDISILNNLNENVTGQQGVPAAPQADINMLLDRVNNQNVAIRVSAGDMFVYRSQSGDYFVVLISDINTGTLPPQKGRVSIMFNRVN